MTITDEQRWQWFKKFWDEFKGDIFKYDDDFMFSPTTDGSSTSGGKDLESFVDRMMRKEKK